ncbi:MAG: site-specific integrase [Spirochaetia bacterium]|nr:site-specific integrase [Spirochaetia bacterium]
MPKLFKKKGCKNYFFVITINGKRKCYSTSTPRKRDAEKVMGQIINRNENCPGVVLFSDYLKEYLDPSTNPRRKRFDRLGKGYSLGYARELAHNLKNYALPYLKDYDMLKMKRRDTMKFQEYLLDTIPDKKRTINKVISNLRSIYSEGISRGDFEFNPFAKIGNVSYQQETKDVLTAKELQLLFSRKDYFPNDLVHRVMLFTAATGMRMGEVLAVTWEQYHDGTLNVDRKYNPVTRKIEPPKINRSRVILLSQTARAAMGKRGFGYVFQGKRREHLMETWWNKNIKKTITNSGIQKKITGHCFRHSLNTC